MADLRSAIREVTSGQGGVVEIVGEPGLGKTRLVQELRKLFMGWVGAASGRLPLWLEGRAASYAAYKPYGLFQQLLCAWAGATPEHGEEVAYQGLHRAMRAAYGRKVDEEQVNLLAQVIGLTLPEGLSAGGRRSPEQLQKARNAAITKLLSRLAHYGPTVVALKDLHWADPTSLRLTEELGSLATQGPLMMLLTRRPEPDPGATALEGALGEIPGLRLRRIKLSPLGEEAERQLVGSLLGDVPSGDVLSVVSRGAAGNPLFLEEHLASLVETGALVLAQGRGWEVGALVAEELPEAIERLVRARVDRLDAGPRQALVAASVLGPEFGLGALQVVSELNGDLNAAVSDLCAAGLLAKVREIPEPVFRFRHSLIQEATYQGLLRGTRRDLHARAAWGLEQAAAGRTDEVAGLLGHHYAIAGEPERAVHYLEIAGDRAASTFANDEARAHYRRLLELLGSSPQEMAHAAEVWMKLGFLAWRVAQFTESRDAFSRAAQVAPSTSSC